jgi:hypothetical protein
MSYIRITRQRNHHVNFYIMLWMDVRCFNVPNIIIARRSPLCLNLECDEIVRTTDGFLLLVVPQLYTHFSLTSIGFSSSYLLKFKTFNIYHIQNQAFFYVIQPSPKRPETRNMKLIRPHVFSRLTCSIPSLIHINLFLIHTLANIFFNECKEPYYKLSSLSSMVSLGNLSEVLGTKTGFDGSLLLLCVGAFFVG